MFLGIGPFGRLQATAASRLGSRVVDVADHGRLEELRGQPHDLCAARLLTGDLPLAVPDPWNSKIGTS